MQANSHVLRSILNAVVIGTDVDVEKLLVINIPLFHALDHWFRTEISQQGVVELDIPAAKGVQLSNLLLIRDSDIVEILV